MGNEMSYNSGNKAALALVAPEMAANKTIFVDAAYMPKMIQPDSWTNEAREAMANAYTTFKQGK
jgi:putrescine transport system substrate-binding protein